MGRYIEDDELSTAPSPPAKDMPFSHEVEHLSMLAQAKDAAVRFRKSQIWNIAVGGGSVLGSPVVSNGLIFFGCCDKNLYAVNGQGRERWKFSTGHAVCGTPLVDRGTVYFGSYDGLFYAVDMN